MFRKEIKKNKENEKRIRINCAMKSSLPKKRSLMSSVWYKKVRSTTRLDNTDKDEIFANIVYVLYYDYKARYMADGEFDLAD